LPQSAALGQMNQDKRLEFYKDRYQSELDHREKIEGRIRTPLPMLVIVAGISGFLIKNTVLEKLFCFHWSLYLLILIGSATFIVSLYYFLRAIYGYHYQLIPTSERLENYYNEIFSEYQKVSPGDARKWTNEEFEKYLMASYIEYGTQNTKNNDAKSLNLNNCIGSLIVAFICSSLAYLPYYWNSVSQ
jgi:hypothetical protein